VALLDYAGLGGELGVAGAETAGSGLAGLTGDAGGGEQAFSFRQG
jgi:hypothetical protein